jgi:tRNA A37 threonylcarbamoyladenosine synthetase subunit TsaC/SUA5/YrdC
MDEFRIQDAEIAHAYESIRDGELAIIPSCVGYTLLGNGEHAIRKMFEVKGRPLSKPCVVLTKHAFLPEIAEIPPQYLSFIDAIEERKLLCGFILKQKQHALFDSLSEYVRSYSRRDDGTSCFVVNAGRYIQYLVERALADGTVIVGSSANKSGTGNEGVFANIPANIRERAGYAIEDDLYVSREYNHATREQGVMVSLVEEKPVVTRKGLMYAEIEDLIQEKIMNH